MTAEPLPEWFIPPTRGWVAEDLDHLPPEAPRHLELLDGALIVTARADPIPHEGHQPPGSAARGRSARGVEIAREMTVTLGKRQRPEPDILAVRKDGDLDLGLTSYKPEDVLLAVEIVSQDSELRDRVVKPERYAAAGIRHYWRVEEESGLPVIHIYELDDTTCSYVATAIVRDRTSLTVPFVVELDPARLTT